MTVDWKELKANWMEFDPFDNSVDDVEKTHAMESYLWELYVLLHHYDPNCCLVRRSFIFSFCIISTTFGS